MVLYLIAIIGLWCRILAKLKQLEQEARFLEVCFKSFFSYCDVYALIDEKKFSFKSILLFFVIKL